MHWWSAVVVVGASVTTSAIENQAITEFLAKVDSSTRDPVVGSVPPAPATFPFADTGLAGAQVGFRSVDEAERAELYARRKQEEAENRQVLARKKLAQASTDEEKAKTIAAEAEKLRTVTALKLHNERERIHKEIEVEENQVKQAELRVLNISAAYDTHKKQYDTEHVKQRKDLLEQTTLRKAVEGELHHVKADVAVEEQEVAKMAQQAREIQETSAASEAEAQAAIAKADKMAQEAEDALRAVQTQLAAAGKTNAEADTKLREAARQQQAAEERFAVAHHKAMQLEDVLAEETAELSPTVVHAKASKH